jgi:DNA-binding NarL/FixJ family response regulator
MDGRAAVAAFQELRPDLVLLDIGLPLLNGIEAARQIKRISPDARILILTMQTDKIYVEEALRAGASGYVGKQSAANELVKAIRTVLLGRTYVSASIAARTGRAGWPVGATQSVGYHLTPRQREVLQLVAEGKSLKEIAHILHISVRTVEFHKTGIMEELGLHTTAELTAMLAITVSLKSQGLNGEDEQRTVRMDPPEYKAQKPGRLSQAQRRPARVRAEPKEKESESAARSSLISGTWNA